MLDIAPAAVTLRPYQADADARVRERIRAGARNVLVVGPTGMGKTVFAAHVIVGAVRKGRKALFLAHREELLDQCYGKLRSFGLAESHLGVIAASRKSLRRPQAPVQIASVGTLVNRRVPPADLVFIDEAHHANAKSYRDILARYPEACVLGLTATPCRADGKGLGEVFSELVPVVSFAELVTEGFLVAPRVFSTREPPDLSGVKTSHGDYASAQLGVAMNRPQLVGDIVDHWVRRAEGRTTVVFAASVEHSLAIVERFREAGIAAEHLDGKTVKDERTAILGRLASGATQVVANMGVLCEGWDLPRCKCVVLARPTKSLALALQMMGRGLRPWDDVSALLLDHAGAVVTHGFPQDEREWSLDGTTRRGGSRVSVRTCPSCFAALPGGTAVCSECGHVFEAEERGGPEQVPGELIEIAPRAKVSMDERVAAYAAILSEGVARGRKVGWCRHRYQERFGIWPAGPRLVVLERTHYPRPTVTELAAQAPALNGGDVLAEAPIAAASVFGTPLAPPAPAPVRARRLSFEALFAPPVVAPAPMEVESWAL